MAELEAVLFDVDGVIIDSMAANAEYYARILETAGQERPAADRIHTIFHLPLDAALGELAGTDDPGVLQRLRALARQEGMYPEELVAVPDGERSILEGLFGQYRLGVVTSRLQGGLQFALRVAGVGDLIEVGVAFEDYSRPKPDPEPLRVALGRLGILPEHAVYVGDSDTDIMAANAAGTHSIHLSPRTHPGATLGITAFSEIPAAISQIAAL